MHNVFCNLRLSLKCTRAGVRYQVTQDACKHHASVVKRTCAQTHESTADKASGHS